jgi:hypothetical protein
MTTFREWVAATGGSVGAVFFGFPLWVLALSPAIAAFVHLVNALTDSRWGPEANAVRAARQLQDAGLSTDDAVGLTREMIRAQKSRSVSGGRRG